MKIKSKVIALPIKDIDTDLIIPADYLKGTNKDGLGEHVFQRLRDETPDFPFNLPKYSDSKILITDDNFGCGSSREHAAWALCDWGIGVIIAPSFSDIFKNNALKNGIILVELAKNLVLNMLKNAEENDLVLEVDLEAQEIVFEDGKVYKFAFDPYRKHCILNNMDDLDYLLSNSKVINIFEESHKKNLFFDISTL